MSGYTQKPTGFHLSTRIFECQAGPFMMNYTFAQCNKLKFGHTILLGCNSLVSLLWTRRAIWRFGFLFSSVYSWIRRATGGSDSYCDHQHHVWHFWDTTIDQKHIPEHSKTNRVSATIPWVFEEQVENECLQPEPQTFALHIHINNLDSQPNQLHLLDESISDRVIKSTTWNRSRTRQFGDS